MAWDTACPDWSARIQDGRSLIPDLPIDAKEAARAVAIFDRLKLPDVPGTPLMKDAAGDWMRDLVRAVFGSGGINPATNARWIQEFFALVGKKNSKTTGGASIMVTALLMNKRPRAEFLLIAPTLAIADLAFNQAVGMIEADEVLAKKFHVTPHLKSIRYRPTGAVLRVKSFDPKIVTGAKPSGVLLDELHVIASAPDADRVIGQLRGGMISQPEAFFITITTQSERPPAGVFKAELQKARNVRDGLLKAPILPVLYEFPESVDWRNPDNWWMVVPNRGRSITIERLKSEFEVAEATGEAELIRWASQHLNVEIGLALGSDAWAGARYWEGAADEELRDLDALLDRSEVAVVGIDGGGLDDLLGLAVLGRCKTTKDWLLWSHAWAHEDVLERRKEIVPRLRDFEREGSLTICKEPTQDVQEVAEIAARVRDAGLLPEKYGVGLDPVGVAQIIDELAAKGISGDALAPIFQGYKLAGSVWGMERKLKDGTFWHAGFDLMAFCVGNAKAEQKGNAVLITKQAAGKAKIDPLVAAFDAVALMSRNPEASGGPSVYATRGALVI